jgi:peptide/nickel transport system permease protein
MTLIERPDQRTRSASKKAGLYRRLWQWSTANPLLSIAILLIAVIVITAIFAPLLAPYPADAQGATHPTEALLAPSWAHPFGTDQLGRDILSRVIYGCRIDPLVAVAVILIAAAIGVPLGLFAAYFGGTVDNIIMRITDVFLAVPALLLALLLASVLQPSLGSEIAAIAIAWWPWYARLVRGEAASVAGRRFVESARVLALPHRTILFKHMLPNSITPLAVQMSMDFGGVILTAAALAFLGLGIQDPAPAWGLMVSEGVPYFETQWWIVTFPGLAILLAAVAFNLLGDGLRDGSEKRRYFLR